MAIYRGKSPDKRSDRHVPPSQAPEKELTRWQLLVNKYNDEVNPGSQPSFTNTGTEQSVEEEFAAYTSSRVVQTDILCFWHVCFIIQVALFVSKAQS